MEKMRLTESYFECESHVLSGVQNFAKKFFAEQKEYSKNFPRNTKIKNYFPEIFLLKDSRI